MQSLIASSPGTVKLQVKREAWYRVTAQELFDAGLDRSVDPRALQLFVDGKQQAISVTGEADGRLDLGDSVEIYGMGIDSPYSDLRTYYLVAAKQAGLRISNLQSPAYPSPGGSFEFTVERRDRSIYFAALRNGDKENFFGAVVAFQPVNQTLTINHLAPSGASATLKVALQGVTNFSHLVSVRLNGTDVGQLVFDGQSTGESTIIVSPSLLREGQNQVTLIAQEGPSDVSLVDYVQLTYQHKYTADDSALKLVASAGQQLTIDGFTNDQIRVFDVSDPYAVSEVAGYVSKDESGVYSVSLIVAGERQRSLLALTMDRATRVPIVTPNYPSNLRAPAQGADLLIVSRRELLDSVRQLTEMRQKQGLSVAVVDIEDIYDEFSYGQKTPRAVKDFIGLAKTNWKKPIKYVLFFGDASLDPKNYLGLGDFDLVPTKLIDTMFMETASDDWLADFDGDGITDVAIGRLPVRTAAEAQAMIEKVGAYEQGNAAEEALLVSDRNDGYNFETANAALKPLLPAGVRVVEVKRSQLGDQATKAALIDGINRGQRIVNYAGHGSLNAWRGDVFNSAAAIQLKNREHLTMFTIMNCLNAYFQDPATDSLAESLLKSPEGGAVAVWASSSMTFAEGQAVMNQEFYRQLFSVRARLGDATMRAKAMTYDLDVRRTWILLADPTMKVR
ncbi:MAG: C25 family cysteine peptidase [Acidobacteriota bacterium]